ncbi:rust resistance kinase Lr10-like [Humulus lupulus]|uniref:rust resistance kinase Lr10-like n=1 Tax=Humulus lupulus TaxID=3486 RepID=UPI002B4162EA|nr:rust resistance kinase Lr10-like [Humulus lupulus]
MTMRVSSPRLLFFIILPFLTVAVADQGLGIVAERRCSKKEPPIRFPFRFKQTQTQPNYPIGFDISCTSRNGTILLLPTITGAELYVRGINYVSQEIQIYYDSHQCLPALLLSENNSSSRPFKFPFQFRYDRRNDYASHSLLDCSSAPDLEDRFCRVKLVPSKFNIEMVLFERCAKMYDTATIPDDIYKVSISGNDRSYVTLTWSEPDCRACEANRKGCRLKNHSGDQVECFDLPLQKKGATKFVQIVRSTLFIVLAISVFCSIVLAVLFYLYTTHKDDKEHQQRIETFLEDYIALKPSRYTYSDIKRITNHLKDKLGEGAYGTVFKGKLSSEIMVAVKILNNSKGNGEEFLNEVATIGQIHHVNVVRLVGYCAEGFKRALVYEFLPNGSLNNYITLEASGGHCSLSWETLQDIAIGVAKGIEYLHQGCDQRILHFDIKPHNVLLDHNFKPKISDFGLAKLCSKDQSLVSMTTVRGTIGYMAPEVFSKNFGNVSYKSDVYSFGMLLLEIVGGRKNTTETNEIYYPEWIYNHLEEGEDLRIQIEEVGDNKIASKLAIVGLWCIQWHPVGRPMMKDVVQMLEGVKVLNMPPNPFVTTGQVKQMQRCHQG